MSGNGRLAVPGQMNVSTTYADGPLAQPSSVALQGHGGMQILVCGGLTKVEALAGQIAAGMASAGSWKSSVDEMADQAAIAVRIAESILDQCAVRRDQTSAKETS